MLIMERLKEIVIQASELSEEIEVLQEGYKVGYRTMEQMEGTEGAPDSNIVSFKQYKDKKV